MTKSEAQVGREWAELTPHRKAEADLNQVPSASAHAVAIKAKSMLAWSLLAVASTNMSVQARKTKMRREKWFLPPSGVVLL